jgi:hypothetical protein
MAATAIEMPGHATTATPTATASTPETRADFHRCGNKFGTAGVVMRKVFHSVYRSWRLSGSEFCSVAARTVLAAAGGCSPVDRCASRAPGEPELPCLPSWRRWRSGLVGGVPATVHCPGRGPASRCLIVSPRPRLPITGPRDGLTVAGSEVCYQHLGTRHRQPHTPTPLTSARYHSLPLTIAPAAANPARGIHTAPIDDRR